MTKTKFNQRSLYQGSNLALALRAMGKKINTCL